LHSGNWQGEMDAAPALVCVRKGGGYRNDRDVRHPRGLPELEKLAAEFGINVAFESWNRKLS
jgi:hypothetical protein